MCFYIFLNKKIAFNAKFIAKGISVFPYVL